MKFNVYPACLIFIFLSASTAAAQVSSSNMNKFNVTCPSEELCPQMEKEYQECYKNRQSSACTAFLQTFKKLLPTYDCHRSFDTDSVPAVWLCEGQRADDKRGELEDYVELLSQLKTQESNRLFGSEKFRQILDGALAEDYYDKSVKVEKKMKKK